MSYEITAEFTEFNPSIASYRVSVTSPSGVVADLGLHALAQFPLTFDLPAPLDAGDTKFSMQPVDANGAPVGAEVSDVITTAAPVMPNNVPTSIKVSLV
jgi:hypothetical protein